MIVCGYDIRRGQKKHIKIPVLQPKGMEGFVFRGKIRGKL